MDKVSIKKEIDDDLQHTSSYSETLTSSSSSARSGIYTSTATSSGGVHPPTQRVSPTSTPPTSRTMASMVPSLVDSTMSLSPPGTSSDYQRSIYKLKRFLSTLIKFGTDISATVGDKVRDMIFNLVSGLLSVGDFHRQLQEVTNFPVRPYVLPFLHANVPLLQREIQSMALAANKKVLEYLRIHEHSIFQPSLEPGLAEANDIFHSEAVESHRKRRTSSNSETGSEVGLAKRVKPNNTAGIGHISPPLFHGGSAAAAAHASLFPRKDMFGGGGGIGSGGTKWSSVYPGKLAIVPGCPSSAESNSVKPEVHATSAGSSGGPPASDDEWKNVQVMLNCILGMVEKTQRAITILQQRQSTTSHHAHHGHRTPEDIIDEVQTSAVRAVNEVKQNALNEIARARQELMLLRRGGGGGGNGGGGKEVSNSAAAGLLRISTSQADTTPEICWNCGRLGSETCSGCKIAKYCGPFCQHKDWESHHRICRSAAVNLVGGGAGGGEQEVAAVGGHVAALGVPSAAGLPLPLDLNSNKTSAAAASVSADNGADL